MAHKPRPRKPASVDEILNGAARKEPSVRAGRDKSRGPLGAGGNVRGEITDHIILQELASLQKQKAYWHVMGLDKQLDAAVLSADEHTAVGELKTGADNGTQIVMPVADTEVDEEEKQLQRMREEIEVLDRMAAIMREKPQSPDRPSSPQRPLGQSIHRPPAHAPVPEHGHAWVYEDSGQVNKRDPSQFERSDHGGLEARAIGMRAAAAADASTNPSQSPAAPPVPGGFLGSPGVAEYWKVEKEQLRAQEQAKQRSYKEQLDLQKMDEAMRQKGSVHHGRRSITAEPPTGTSLQWVVERDDNKEERKRRYRRELDLQMQEKASPVKSHAYGSHLSSPLNRDGPTHARYGAAAAADAGGGSQAATASASPGLKEAATKVGSMHWGERDVERWYEEEAKKKEYKEELLQQMRQKQDLQRKQASEASSLHLHHVDASPPARLQGARVGGAAIRDLAPQFALPDTGEGERAALQAAGAGAQGASGWRPPQPVGRQPQPTAGFDANGAHTLDGHPAYYMQHPPSQHSLRPPAGGAPQMPMRADGLPPGLMPGLANANLPSPGAWGDEVPSAARVIPGTGRPMWVERSGEKGEGTQSNGVGPAAVGFPFEEAPGMAAGGASPTASYVSKEQFDAVVAKMHLLEAQVGQMHQNPRGGGRGAHKRRDSGAATASTGTSSYASSSASRLQTRVPKAGRRAGVMR